MNLFENTTAVQPLLDLSLALAKDLKEEFYEHMWPLFNEVIIVMGKLDVGCESISIFFLLPLPFPVKSESSFILFILFGDRED